MGFKTQKDLAVKCNFPPDMIQKVESGKATKSEVPQNVIDKISSVLQVHLSGANFGEPKVRQFKRNANAK